MGRLTASEAAPARPMRILVVDDEPDLVEILVDMLGDEFDAEFTAAANGEEALSVCRRQHFDLICTDHRMPVMTGAGFLEALRTTPNPNQRTVVIFISGYVLEAKMATEAVLENVFFVDKPVVQDRLFYFARLAHRVMQSVG